jgi:hypothetical protein
MKNSNPSQKEQIKKAIERLHSQNSGDYESLLRQVENKKKKVQLNLAQLTAALSTAPILLLEWGRGTGKTTMRGFRWLKILQEMPRSTGLFIGPTYQFILTRIVPSLVQGLEMFGIYKDLHYFVGKQPPRGWRNSWVKAYQPPENFTRYITFWNGMGVHLISHDVPGDGRSLNADWADGDEAALLKPSNLQENTDPTLRGTNKREFEKSVYFGSRFYTSSTPLTTEGEWFINYESKALQEPSKINFISATCQHNLHNLRDGYLEEAEKNAYSSWVFDAEYKNIRPKFSKNGFYPLLDADIHQYSNFNYSHYQSINSSVDCRGDADLVKGVPLILGIDWGASINCLTVNQHLKSIREYRTIKSMFVLGEDQKIQDDLFDDFHRYYKHHNNRNIFLWFDNTGNVKTGITRRNRAELARKQLTNLGWKVNLLTYGGRNPDHTEKHTLWNEILKGTNQQLPVYRINKHNAREAFLSMRAAKAIPGKNNQIHKDKSSERSKKIQRQYATDLSDANDAPIYGLFRSFLNSFGSPLPSSNFSNH